MPKTKISEFSATPGNNTDIDGINIAEGCAPSGINDAIRELMSQLKDFQAGTAGDSFNGPVGTTTAAAGAFTNLSASGTFALTGDQVQISEGGTGQTTANAAFNALAPSQATHAGKYLKTDGTNTSWDALDISTADITGTLPVANGGTGVTSSTGTGSVVLSASPTFTGTVNGASLTLSSNFTLSGGTANGVAYLNGSKVLTTGSALTFDGTNLGVVGNIAGTVQSSVRNDNATTNAGAKLATLYSSTEITSLGHYWNGSQFLGKLNALSDLLFTINNAEKMLLTSSGLEVKQSQLIGYSSYAGIGTNGLAVAGNVGIGTSSPADKLHIVGTGTNAGAGYLVSRFMDSTNAKGVFLGYDTDELAGTIYGVNFLTFQTYNGSAWGERMRLDASGNLGLGVTPSAWTDYRAMQVGSLGSIAFDGGSSMEMFSNVYYSSGAFRYISSSASARPTRYAQGNGVHYWYNALSGTAGDPIDFGGAKMTLSSDGTFRVKGAGTAGSTDAVQFAGSAPASSLILDSSGRLLVGATTASGVGNASLGVVGGAVYDGNFSITAQFSNDTTSAVKGVLLGFNNSTNTGIIASAYGNGTESLAFWTHNNVNWGERARITSDGDFYVGTANALTAAGRISVAFNQSSAYGLILRNTNATATSIFVSFENSTGGSNGNISQTNSTTVAYNTSSDRRLKKDIMPAPQAGADIDAIEVVSHGWVSNNDTVKYGVVAQDLQAVAPQAVSAGDDKEEIERTWGVDYSKLVPMLIKEIQSLRARVAALEAA